MNIRDVVRGKDENAEIGVVEVSHQLSYGGLAQAKRAFGPNCTFGNSLKASVDCRREFLSFP